MLCRLWLPVLVLLLLVSFSVPSHADFCILDYYIRIVVIPAKFSSQLFLEESVKVCFMLCFVFIIPVPNGIPISSRPCHAALQFPSEMETHFVITHIRSSCLKRALRIKNRSINAFSLPTRLMVISMED